MQKKSKNDWGFDTSAMDKSVRPQDDFYRYVNGGWLKTAKIPKDESRWGSFIILRYNTEHQLRALIDEVLKKSHPKGSDAQLVADAYRAAADMKRRNALGIKPIFPFRLRIRNIKTTAELVEEILRLHSIGFSELWGVGVDQDSKNSSRYLLHLWQGGLGLPERDYYLLNNPEQVRVREAYIKHIEKILVLAGYSAGEAVRAQKTILKIETQLAKAAMKKEDAREPEKIYNKMSLGQITRLAPMIPWSRYFSVIFAGTPKEIIVGQPKFFAAMSKLLKTIPLEEWKTYFDFHLINGSASALSDSFIKENFDFYGRTLTGQQKMRAPWRRALGSVNGTVGEALGKLYVKEYFPPQAKQEMDVLVSDLFEVYRERIKNLDWMSSTTKKKALQKLSTMKRKIGYPTKWEGYKGLEISATDHFGNVLRSSEYEQKREMKKLKKPVDRSEWFMYPHTVNAYFHPNLNEIVFPTAILQWPFFDPNADMAFNYGSIGSVIGHEITHGFDDSGAKFDYQGNLKSWWSKEDKKRFEKKSKVFVQQSNKHEVEPGVFLNGKLTLGENMADMGGLIIGYYAYQKYLAKHGRKEIDGLSPEQRFFFGFAQMERELASPEFKKLAALTDPHAQATWRINDPLSNFEPFYKEFGVKKGDKLYREPKTRANVW